jgi:hypothetical protein
MMAIRPLDAQYNEDAVDVVHFEYIVFQRYHLRKRAAVFRSKHLPGAGFLFSVHLWNTRFSASLMSEIKVRVYRFRLKVVTQAMLTMFNLHGNLHPAQSQPLLTAFIILPTGLLRQRISAEAR